MFLVLWPILKKTVKQSFSPIVPSPPLAMHSGNCAYQVLEGQPGAFRCTLGCENMLYATNPSPSGPVSHTFTPNNFSTPPPPYSLGGQTSAARALDAKEVRGQGLGKKGGGGKVFKKKMRGLKNNAGPNVVMNQNQLESMQQYLRLQQQLFPQLQQQQQQLPSSVPTTVQTGLSSVTGK